MIRKEYYVLSEDPENEMIVNAADSDIDDLLLADDYLEPDTLLTFCFYEEMIGDPIPFDLLTESGYPIVSLKLKEVLELFDCFPALQFVESTISFKDQLFKDYFYLHIINFIECVDEENSIFRKRQSSGNFVSFKKLALSEDNLKKIPFKQRLVFRLKRKSSLFLFHESVVEAVMKVSPTGLRFYHVDEWYSFINC